MAGLAKALAVLLTLLWSTAEGSPFKRIYWTLPLALPEVDWTESINAYLRKIPNNLTLPDFIEDNQVLGVEIGSASLTGLGDLWVYKPYSTACLHPDTTQIEATGIRSSTTCCNHWLEELYRWVRGHEHTGIQQPTTTFVQGNSYE
ncbi:hypothetical protein MTO96_011718 [Rhipicephalus appendiculatus]